MQKFQNKGKIQIQGLFKDFKGLEFFSKIQGLSRTSQGPYEPCCYYGWIETEQ